MARFEIEVATVFDTSSLKKFVSEVTEGLMAISRAAALPAARTGAGVAAIGQDVDVLRTQAEAGMRVAGASGIGGTALKNAQKKIADAFNLAIEEMGKELGQPLALATANPKVLGERADALLNGLTSQIEGANTAVKAAGVKTQAAAAETEKVAAEIATAQTTAATKTKAATDKATVAAVDAAESQAVAQQTFAERLKASLARLARFPGEPVPLTKVAKDFPEMSRAQFANQLGGLGMDENVALGMASTSSKASAAWRAKNIFYADDKAGDQGMLTARQTGEGTFPNRAAAEATTTAATTAAATTTVAAEEAATVEKAAATTAAGEKKVAAKVAADTEKAAAAERIAAEKAAQEVLNAERRALIEAAATTRLGGIEAGGTKKVADEFARGLNPEAAALAGQEVRTAIDQTMTRLAQMFSGEAMIRNPERLAAAVDSLLNKVAESITSVGLGAQRQADRDNRPKTQTAEGMVTGVGAAADVLRPIARPATEEEVGVQIDYIASMVELTTLRKEIKAIELGVLAGEDAYLKATVQVAQSRAELAAAESLARRGSAPYMTARGAQGATQLFERAETTSATVGAVRGGEGMESLAIFQGEAAAGMKELGAGTKVWTAKFLAANEKYIQQEAEATVGMSVLKAAIAARADQMRGLGQATLGPALPAGELGATALFSKAAATSATMGVVAEGGMVKLGAAQGEAAASTKELAAITKVYTTDFLKTNREYIERMAQGVVGQKDLNDAVKVRAAEMREARNGGGGAAAAGGGSGSGGGGFMGGFMGMMGGMGGAGGGGLMGSVGGFLGMQAQFAAFTVFMQFGQAIRQSVAQAEILNRQMALLHAQATAIGQGDYFGAFRASIEQTARSTGVAATDVATLAGEFLGLYGNVTQATVATQAAAEIINVSGEAAAKAAPNIATVAQDLGASVQDIGNQMINVSNKTGRARSEILDVFGQLAPVAAEYNLSLQQMANLTEAVGKSSALSGQMIGQLLDRWLTQMPIQMAKIAQQGIKFSPEAGQGDMMAAIKDMVAQYPSLTQQQQAGLIQVVGPRQAQILAALATNKDAYAALNQTSVDNTLLTKANAAAQDTIAGAMNRVKAAFATLGEEIVRSGVGQAFLDLLKVFLGLMDALDRLFGYFSSLNSALDGIPGRMVEILIGVKLLTVAWGALQATIATGNIVDMVTGLAAGARSGSMVAGFARMLGVGGAATAEVAGPSLMSMVTAGTFTGAAAGSTGIATGGASLLELVGAGAFSGGGVGALGTATAAGAAGATPLDLVMAGVFTGEATGASTAGLGASVATGAAAGSVVPVVGTVIGAAMAATALTVMGSEVKGASKDYNKLVADFEKDNAVQAAARVAKLGGPDAPYPAQQVTQRLGGQGGGGAPGAMLGYWNPLAWFAGAPAAPRTVGQAQEAAGRYTTVKGQETGLTAMRDAGVLSTKDTQTLEDSLKNVTDPKNFQRIEDIWKKYSTTDQGKAAIAAAAAADARNKALAKEAQQAGNELVTLPAIKAAFDSGQINYDEWVRRTNEYVTNIANLQDPTSTQDRLKAIKDLADQHNKAIAAMVTEQTTFNQTIGGIAGDYATLRTLITTLLGLEAEGVTAANAATVLQFANQYEQTQQSIAQKSVANARTLQEYIKAVNTPVVIPGAVADAIIQADFATGGEQSIPTYLLPRFQAEATNKLREAARNMMETVLENQGATVARAVAEAWAQFPDVAVPTVTEGFGQTPRDIALGSMQKANELTAAQAAYGEAAANASFNAVEAARQRMAAAGTIAAKIQATDQQLGTDYTQDPAWITAMGAATTTRAEYMKTITAQFDSHMKLLQAMATAAGDPIGAAKDEVTKIKADIARMKAAGAAPDSQAMQDLQSQLITAQAGVVSTTISTSEQLIQNDLDLRRITVGQAVARLQALESVATSQVQLDEIKLRIKALLGQANQNLQFNLPTDISLPTLYQARRLNQTPAGIGYQDNRNININLSVNNQLDLAQAQQMLTGMLGTASPVYGSATRRY